MAQLLATKPKLPKFVVVNSRKDGIYIRVELSGSTSWSFPLLQCKSLADAKRAKLRLEDAVRS